MGRARCSRSRTHCNKMENDDLSLVRSIRLKLSCFQCAIFVESPFTLSQCHHVFCSICIENIKKSTLSPCCGGKVNVKDITCSRLLSNIAQTFGEFYDEVINHYRPKIADLCHTSDSELSLIQPQNNPYEANLIGTVDNSDIPTSLRDARINAITLPTHILSNTNSNNKVRVTCKSKPTEDKVVESASNTFFDCDWNGESILQSTTDYPDQSAPEKIDYQTIQIDSTAANDAMNNHEQKAVPKTDTLQMTPEQVNSPSFPLDTCPLTQQNSYVRLQQEINKSKAALENLLTDTKSVKLQTLDTLGTPLGSLNSTGTITQQNTINSVEAEILQSKHILCTLLQTQETSKARPSSSESISHNDEWTHTGLSVVAEYGNLANLLLFEESCKRGWISCSNKPIDIKVQKPKYFISEAVVEEQDGVLLVRRTVQYMKCMLSGFQIIDFSWLKDSISKGRILNPLDYEVGGTDQDQILQSPQRFRTRTDGNRASSGSLSLLGAYEFIILNDASSPKIKVNDVEELIELGGGSISSQFGMRNAGKLTVVLSLRLKRKNFLKRDLAMDLSNSVISVSWLFDFICDLQEPVNWTEYFVCELVR